MEVCVIVGGLSEKNTMKTKYDGQFYLAAALVAFAMLVCIIDQYGLLKPAKKPVVEETTQVVSTNTNNVVKARIHPTFNDRVN